MPLAPVKPQRNVALSATTPRASVVVEVLDVPAWVEQTRRGDENAARALLNHLYPLVLSVVAV